MNGPKWLTFMLKNLGTSIEDYFKKHSTQFQAVNTGRGAKYEYIYHGFKDKACRCMHCGGRLKKKEMYLKSQGPKIWVCNGIPRTVEDAQGNLYLIWVCSCQCEACKKRQRVLPACILRYCHYCAHVIYGVVGTLFTVKELKSPKPLKPTPQRGWQNIPFYGEESTVYRWRKIVIHSNKNAHAM